MELFGSKEKSKILKTYEFCTMGDIAYVLDMKTSVIYNFRSVQADGNPRA